MVPEGQRSCSIVNPKYKIRPAGGGFFTDTEAVCACFHGVQSLTLLRNHVKGKRFGYD